MNAFLFPAGRRRISAHNSGDYRHDYACDTQPPNHAAHRRGFVVILIVVGVAGCVALIGGMLQGLSDMGAAFPSGSALFEAAAWDRFFAGFGRGNGSNPNIQVLDPTGHTFLYMSGLAPGP